MTSGYDLRVGTTGPAQYATLASAVAAAGNGDSIVVYPGTYSESIDFLGKDLLIESAFGNESVVFTAATGWNATGGEGYAATLADVTLLSRGTYAVYAVGAQVTGDDLVIAQTDGYFGYATTGGGVAFSNSLLMDNAYYYGSYSTYGSLSFTGCEVRNNLAWYYGGLVFADDGSTLTVTSSNIHDNVGASSAGAI